MKEMRVVEKKTNERNFKSCDSPRIKQWQAEIDGSMCSEWPLRNRESVKHQPSEREGFQISTLVLL